MKRTMLLILGFTLVGCAAQQPASHTQASATKMFVTEKSQAYLTVLNKHATSIHVLIQRDNTKPVYLGRVYAYDKKRFSLEGPFNRERITVYAKPIVGKAIKAALPVSLEEGKTVAWQVGDRNVSWTE